jgi:hypothetical protein
MKKYLLIIIMVLFAFSCSQPKMNSESHHSKRDTTAKTPVQLATVNKPKKARADTVNGEYPGWVDTLLIAYVKHTKNESVSHAMAHHLKEEWILDDRKKTDSASYWVFNVGHNVSEPDGTEKRYISDSWVYVDSLKRKLYEYGPDSGKLVEWKK